MLHPSLKRLPVLLLLALPGLVRGHSGPPFPIVHDQPIPGYIASVWADPDIGEATFFVVLEPDKSGVHPEVSGVSISVQPVSGRLPKTTLEATRDMMRRSLRFTALPELDAQEMWRVNADIRMADGTLHAFVTEVEATPPGGGAWGLVVYLFPFLLFGGLWVLVFVRRSRQARAVRPVAVRVADKSSPSSDS